MMTSELHFEKNRVFFIKDNGFDYHLEDPSEHREKHVTTTGKDFLNVSEWIAHLLEKGWVTKAQLVALARIIHDHFPNKKIDWFNTWMLIEYVFDERGE